MERAVGGKRASGTERVGWMDGWMERGWMRSKESGADQQQARGWGWRWRKGEVSDPDRKVFWLAAPELGCNSSQQ